MNNGFDHRRGLDPVERHRRASFLRRTAKETRTYRTKMRLLTAALAVLILLTAIFFIIATLYNRSGSFTIMVDKVDMTKYGLSLSEYPDMAYKSSHLNMEIDKSMTNIDGRIITDAIDGEYAGEHNGMHYVAYTFYLENAGDTDCTVEYTVDMSGITNGLDDAIRLRLYVDGVPTTYAKMSADGTPEPATTPFISSTIMMRSRFDVMHPAEKHRFTAVIWIEGNDPECLDWLIGGQMKIGMNFGIVH